MIGGQTRLSKALGDKDPRNSRGGFLIDGLFTSAPVGVKDGKVTILRNMARNRDVLRWNGQEWAPDSPWFEVTPIKTAAYLATYGQLVRCNPTAAGFTVTLPTASGYSGWEILVKNVSASANVVTIDGAGAETIDGAANTTIAAGYGSKRLVSNGSSEWMCT